MPINEKVVTQFSEVTIQKASHYLERYVPIAVYNQLPDIFNGLIQTIGQRSWGTAIRQYLHERHQLNVDNYVAGQAGEYLKKELGMQVFEYGFRRRLNWKYGSLGDPGGCFLDKRLGGGKLTMATIIEKAGGYAMWFKDPQTKKYIGRCFVQPMPYGRVFWSYQSEQYEYDSQLGVRLERVFPTKKVVSARLAQPPNQPVYHNNRCFVVCDSPKDVPETVKIDWASFATKCERCYDWFLNESIIEGRCPQCRG